MEIVGGQGDNASAVTKEVGHEDELQLGSTTIVCIGTPCHTPGHVSYFLPGGSIDAQIEGDAVPAPAVFTGDTLFIAGEFPMTQMRMTWVPAETRNLDRHWQAAAISTLVRLNKLVEGGMD